MLHLLALLALALPSDAAAPLPSAGEHVASSSLPSAALVASKLSSLSLRLPPDLNCSTCELVMSVYTEIASNATTLQEFITLFEDACSVIAPGTPIGALCDALIKTSLQDVLPFLYKELSTLAWDIPETFCSVFIPVCTVPCCATATAPEQLRLALTNEPAAWSVQWTTLQAVSGAGVQWSAQGASGAPSTAAAVARTYALGGWQGTLYSATMAPLAPGTAYTYSVGSAASGWSAPVNFTTLPADAGSPSRPLRLAHIGDMGWGDNSNATIAALGALVAEGGIDALIHTGDVSYADGQQKSWDVYGRKIEAISSRIPYMVGVGNHVRWPAWGARPPFCRSVLPLCTACAHHFLAPSPPPPPNAQEQVWWGGAPYRARWTMPPALNPVTRAPLPASTTANRSFYAIDFGTVLHYAMYDTESVLDISDVSAANAAWLKADLDMAALQGAKWVIAGGHRPLCACLRALPVRCGARAEWGCTLGLACSAGLLTGFPPSPPPPTHIRPLSRPFTRRLHQWRLQEQQQGLQRNG